MAAVRFVSQPQLKGSLTHSVAITSIGMTVLVAAVIIILGNVFMISIVSRRFSLQTEQLAQGALQLKTIFDNLMEGIIVLDIGDSLVQRNPAVSRILGLPDDVSSREDVVRALTVLTLDGAVLAVDEWPSARAVHGHFVNNVELEFRSSYTGKSAIVEVSSAPIVNAAGDLVQAIITYREVSERKRTEEARARLAAIVESSQDAIVGKDLNGTVISWNQGAEKIFGYRADEMIGQSILRLLLPPGQEHEEDGILERIGQGETVDMPDTTRLRKDGKLIHVSLMICPVRHTDGRIVGVSKIARDITERKLLERQLRQSQKMEAIGQLTGGIAHDFNNLLAIVIGNLGLLEPMIGGNEVALRRLKPAQKAASRGADLTRRLLALASKEDLKPASTRLDEAILETIEMVGHALGPEVKIVTKFSASVPPVFVDAAGLASALLNLAVNARDAMPKGGTLTISTEMSDLDESFPGVQAKELKAGAYARITVSDTGHGMSRETLERALEPFFTTKPRNKGTGLGLAMVYGFARQSGGIVRLYSEENYGTTVSLYLPLAGEITSPAIELPAEHLPLHAGGTVLVVDDEAELLEIAHAYLMEMGYSAMRANNAATALLNIAQCKDIDLMITDIIMPGGMNGVELAEKARQINPRLKIIYSSGFPADALVERNGTRADDPMLRKPYQRAEFAAIVQRTLAGIES
jgi:PAS domain S-box-containing protein